MDARERNAAKQRRWRRRHREEHMQARYLADRHASPPPATFRPFEVVYAHGELAGLPAYIGSGKSPVPWETLWEARELPYTRVARWFRSLAERGELPMESTRWLPGGEYGEREAARLARARLAQVTAWCGGHPPWLLNRQPGAARPVVRVEAGRVERFATLADGAASISLPTPMLGELVGSGRADADGGVWLDWEADDDSDGERADADSVLTYSNRARQAEGLALPVA